MITSQRRMIYDWEWQRTRISCSFTSEAKAKEALTRLKAYVVGFPGPQDSEANRIYRVLNLLTATHMGLLGQIKQAEASSKHLRVAELRRIDLAVRGLRTDLAQLQPSDAVVQASNEHRRKALELAWTFEGGHFQIVLEDLERRMEKAKTAESRPELEEYIEMMREVRSGRTAQTTKQGS